MRGRAKPGLAAFRGPERFRGVAAYTGHEARARRRALRRPRRRLWRWWRRRRHDLPSSAARARRAAGSARRDPHARRARAPADDDERAPGRARAARWPVAGRASPWIPGHDSHRDEASGRTDRRRASRRRPEPNVYGAAAIVYSVTEASSVRRVQLRLEGRLCCVRSHSGVAIPWLSRATFRYWQGEPCRFRTSPTHARCG